MKNKKRFQSKINFILIIAFAAAFYAGLEFDRIHAQSPPGKASASKTVKKQAGGKQEGQQAGNKLEDQKREAGKKTERRNAASAPETTILELFKKGGPFMWPLLLASVIAVMLILERLFFFLTNRPSTRKFQHELADSLESGGLDEAHNYLQGKDSLVIARVLNEGYRISKSEPEIFAKGVEREAGGFLARWERGLPVLAAVSAIAPLIGFLGTVWGMIEAFGAIAGADTVNAKIVAAGIQQALITTASGLIVAIMAMVFFQLFSSLVSGFATDIEQAANNVYKHMLQLKDEKRAEAVATT